MQKPEKRLFVRGDVQPLPGEPASWMPDAVRDASEQLEACLDRREEAEIAHEIAEGDARVAARARETAEDEAALAGRAFPAATDSEAVEALTIARRARDSADRVAKGAVEHYLQLLDQNDEQIGAILGERVAAENLRARRALQEVEDALVKAIQLDRLGGTLRNPRYTGSQPMSRTAWETPPPDRHAGLDAVSELFNICGGRQEAIAA
jgi:hypothetical protein